MPDLATIAESSPSAGRGQRQPLDALLSQFRLADPGLLRQGRPAYGAMENGLHWVFGVTPGSHRRDYGPENLGILRRISLNLLYTAVPTCPSAASAAVRRLCPICIGQIR